MRPMHRFVTAALVIGAFLFVACGSGELDSETAGDLQEARADAAQAVERVDSLEARLDALAEQLDDAVLDRKRLNRVTERLESALADLRKALHAAESSADTAAADAASALARADQAARDLAVLEDRYEYHLRRYHGGG